MFPGPIEGQSASFAHYSSDSDASAYQKPGETFDHGKDTNIEVIISPGPLSSFADLVSLRTHNLLNFIFKMGYCVGIARARAHT